MLISEQMGELAGINVKWQHDKVKLDGGEDIKAHMTELEERWGELQTNVKHYGGVVLCDRKAAHKEARVLQVELSKVPQRKAAILTADDS